MIGATPSQSIPANTSAKEKEVVATATAAFKRNVHVPTFITRIKILRPNRQNPSSGNDEDSIRVIVWTKYDALTNALTLFMVPTRDRHSAIIYYASVHSISILKPRSLVEVDSKYVDYLLRALRNEENEDDAFMYELNVPEKQLYIAMKVVQGDITIPIDIAKVSLTIEYIPTPDSDLETEYDFQIRKKHCESFGKLNFMFTEELHDWIRNSRRQRSENAVFSEQLKNMIDYSQSLLYDEDCLVPNVENELQRQLAEILNKKKAIIRQKRQEIEDIKKVIEATRKERAERIRKTREGVDGENDGDNGFDHNFEEDIDMDSDSDGNQVSQKAGEEDHGAPNSDLVLSDPEFLPSNSLNVDYVSNDVLSEIQPSLSFPMPSSSDFGSFHPINIRGQPKQGSTTPSLQFSSSPSSQSPAQSQANPLGLSFNSSLINVSLLDSLNTTAKPTASSTTSVRKRAKLSSNHPQT